MSTSAPSTQGWVLADAFDRAAPTYDAMVALSPGYHDQLLGAAGALLDRLPAPDGSALKVLDLGCGSGASTQALLEQWRTRGGAADLLSVTGVDMSEGMVAQARVLRPGGGVVIHDYSVQGSTRAKAIWATICHGVIIPLAVIKRSDVPLHRYLYTSVRDFDSVARICERLLGAGLVDVRHRTYRGWQRDVIHTVGGSAPS